MSRRTSLSPAALKAMFSPDADATLFTLLTLTGGGIDGAVRLADGYTQRISETAEDVIYGVPSRGHNYTFLPFQITLPTEEDAAPRCRLVLHDVTRLIMPTIRSLTAPPSVLIELVLSSTPDVVEVGFGNFLLANVSYAEDAITAELVMASLAVEPFPQHTFTPSYFPGIF